MRQIIEFEEIDETLLDWYLNNPERVDGEPKLGAFVVNTYSKGSMMSNKIVERKSLIKLFGGML